MADLFEELDDSFLQGTGVKFPVDVHQAGGFFGVCGCADKQEFGFPVCDSGRGYVHDGTTGDGCAVRLHGGEDEIGADISDVGDSEDVERLQLVHRNPPQNSMTTNRPMPSSPMMHPILNIWLPRVTSLPQNLQLVALSGISLLQ